MDVFIPRNGLYRAYHSSFAQKISLDFDLSANLGKKIPKKFNLFRKICVQFDQCQCSGTPKIGTWRSYVRLTSQGAE